MLYLYNADATGNVVYLDIHAVEMKESGREKGFSLSGIVGDGLYEGEVLMEVGEDIEVTFVDAWLGGQGFGDFLRRVGRDALHRALEKAAGEMTFCLQSFPTRAGAAQTQVVGYRFTGRTYPLRPREYGEQLEMPLTVAATGPVWTAVA